MPTDEPPAQDGGASAQPPLLPLDRSSWIVTAVAAFMSYMLVSRGLLDPRLGWQVPLFVGAVTGLAASSVLQGSLVAVAGVASLLVALPPVTTTGRPPSIAEWALGVALSAGVAYAIGAIRSPSVRRTRDAEFWIATLLVLWVLLNLWAPLVSKGWPPSGYGSLRASTIRAVPKPGTYTNDDSLYLRIYYLLHHSDSYYQAYSGAWTGLAASPAWPSSVTSVRLPTLYWIWRALPSDPFSIVYLFLALISLGIVAASCIAGQLAGARFAPLATVALAAYAMGSAHTVYVTYVDLPAMSVALVGVALFLRARLATDWRLLWAAAAVITFAALTREILIYLALLALIGSLFESAENRLRAVVPWLASIGVFFMGYAAHAITVRGMAVPGSAPITYFKGSPLFAIDSFRRFTDSINGQGFLVASLFILALAAAVASRKRAGLPFAVFATAALVAPLVTMLKVGNPGIDAAGIEVNYWGNLYIPFALALWPAWVLSVPSAKASVK